MAAMAHLMLLLSLCIGVTMSTVPNLQKRIIRGKPCERLYHVKLRVADGGTSTLCGGSLISDQWILTAAHCLKPRGTLFANLRVDPDGPVQEVQITSEPVIYTDKDDNGNKRSHDVMLLQLPVPSAIQPVALPDCEYHPKMVEIAGHGATTGGPNDERNYFYLDEHFESSTLQCADTTVTGCQRVLELVGPTDPDKLYQHLFCGQRHEVDTCPGDSGGGVVRNGMIYSVISFSGDSDYVCREPAAFMNVCEYIDWINGVITRQ